MTARPRLRPYQLDALDDIDAAFATVDRVLHQAPTGSGKTVTFTEYIRGEVAADGLVIVLVHRDEILEQTSRALRRFGIRHGIIAPGYDQTSHPVQVASVMTLVRRLDRLPWLPSLLVIDEAHHAVAATWLRIIDALPDARILGVTATPRRLDGKPLDDIFDHLVLGPPIGKLIDDGFLSPVTVFTPAQGPDLSRVAIRAGDYAVDQLSGIMSRGMIIRSAVDEYERLCPDAPAIVFCVDIRHSRLVAEAFTNAGYRAEHVDGETPRQQRRELIGALDSGEIDLLCNCGLISEGLDVPGVEAAVLLRPTKSLALYLQMVGRALRPGKPLAYVLDHAGNAMRHGLPTARRRWSLHGHQQQDNAGDGLRRCPECGAVNSPDADVCEHCGAVLSQQQREARIEVEGPRLAEAVETPVDDAELASMDYHAVLRWASGVDGRLARDWLERVARARGYRSYWVERNAGRRWERVWEEHLEWRARQHAQAGGNNQ